VARHAHSRPYNTLQFILENSNNVSNSQAKPITQPIQKRLINLAY
jgi:hypothetical protein